LSRAQILYQLQLLDSELDQAGKELAEVTALLGESEALQQANARVETADEILRQARTKLQDIDLEVNGLSEKISRQEKMLYSGKTMSPKEAANLQEEVSSLKRWHATREEALLEAMVAVEEAEAGHAEAVNKQAVVQQQWEAGQRELIDKQAALQAKIKELQSQRPTKTAAVAQTELSIYEKLRKRRAGRAVAIMRNSVCEGCGVSASSSRVQRARTGTELEYCSTCGRILYVP